MASGDAETGTTLLTIAIDRGPDTINLEDAYERLGMMHLLNPQHFAKFISPAQERFPENATLTILNQIYRLSLIHI